MGVVRVVRSWISNLIDAGRPCSPHDGPQLSFTSSNVFFIIGTSALAAGRSRPFTSLADQQADS
jgi:hypothetical protein